MSSTRCLDLRGLGAEAAARGTLAESGGGEEEGQQRPGRRRRGGCARGAASRSLRCGLLLPALTPLSCARLLKQDCAFLRQAPLPGRAQACVTLSSCVAVRDAGRAARRRGGAAEEETDGEVQRDAADLAGLEPPAAPEISQQQARCHLAWPGPCFPPGLRGGTCLLCLLYAPSLVACSQGRPAYGGVERALRGRLRRRTPLMRR